MKLNWGWPIFEDWAATADDADVDLIQAALLSLTDGTWAESYVHFDEVTGEGMTLIVEVRPSLWIVAWQLREHPDLFNLAYIGDPDGWTS